jgi:hypothetical protein
MNINDQFLKESTSNKITVNKYIEQAIIDDSFRNLLVHEMCNNVHINVYYHSYCILKEVAKTKSELLKGYRHLFAKLLNHQNSYHVNYAMHLISLTVDSKDINWFDTIFTNFISKLSHNKITTRRYCIEYSLLTAKKLPSLTDRIITCIVNSLRKNSNSTKHQNYLLLQFFLYLKEYDINIKGNPTIYSFVDDIKQGKLSARINKLIDSIA